MENKLYLGFDNGVSGTIGAIYNQDVLFVETPIKKEQSYTKTKANISRIDVVTLSDNLNRLIEGYDNPKMFCLIERPMVNPSRFVATMSALRALEATLNVLELLNIPYQYCDSKEWQKVMLPKGIKGSEELKKASLDIGCRLFPDFKELITKHGDADGILMAEYARRNF